MAEMLCFYDAYGRMETDKKRIDMKKKSGFTIIEVVLVLAIAGLIFLMVFIALPALQRSQADTQRESDISRVQAAIQSFQKVNRGRVPAFDGTASQAWGSCDPEAPTGFCQRFLLVGGDTFEDPDGTPYSFAPGEPNDVLTGSAEGLGSGQFDHIIYVYQSATCNGEVAVASTGSRKVALLYKLEGGGTACVSN